MIMTYLRRELGGRLRQTVLVSLGLAVGVGLVITLSGVSSGLDGAQSTVLESLYGVATDLTVTQPGSAESDGSGAPLGGEDRLISRGLAPIDSDAITSIAKIPGVASSTGSLAVTDVQLSPMSATTDSDDSRETGGVSFSPRMIDVNGVDPTDQRVGPLTSATLISGRTFRATDASAEVALLESSYADQQSLTVGSNIVIAGTSFEIIGVVMNDLASLSDTYIPLSSAQALAGLPNTINTIYVTADDAREVATIGDEITLLLPASTVTTSREVAERIGGSLAKAADLADSLGEWLAVAVMGATFLIASLLTLSTVDRRTRELGTLKALGWPSRRVIGQLIAEAVIKGAIGAILGLALGYLSAVMVTSLSPSLSVSEYQFAGSISRAPVAISVDLTAPVTGNAIAIGVVVALTGALISGIAGAWRATRLGPAAALAHIT